MLHFVDSFVFLRKLANTFRQQQKQNFEESKNKTFDLFDVFSDLFECFEAGLRGKEGEIVDAKVEQNLTPFRHQENLRLNLNKHLLFTYL